MQTTTLQLWPGGASYEYTGDIHGPANQRKLRQHTYGTGPRKRWRKGTATEWRRIEIETRARRYADREVLACQSALVDDLIKHSPEPFPGFGVDDIENLYTQPDDMSAEDCRAWLDDRGISYGENDDEETLRDAIRDNDTGAEVFEWWLVSSWLCDQLRAIGEVVIDNGAGHWWGRTCTGQGYLMDGTLQQIAARFD